jgi:spermidine/putrescine transport system permease protein
MRKQRLHEWFISLPSIVWLTIFFLLPTLIVFMITFRPADPFGGLGDGWTLRTLQELGNPNYPAILWRTIRLSLITTAICVLLAVPAGYGMARAPERHRNLLLMLVVIPFWTSFLIRVFAWKVLLQPQGPLTRLAIFLRIIGPNDLLLYNEGAILAVMIYTYLPFAILPIYAAAEKFDFALLDAARDLGAKSLRAFRSVFLPGIQQGLITALLMVFIPALGSYVIPDIMGGTTSEMLGNKIAQRTFTDRNLPHAAALSALLTLGVLIPMVGAVWYNQKRGTPPRHHKGGH